MANNQRVETLVDWNWVDRELVAFCHIAYGIMYPSTNWRAVARRYLIIGAPQNTNLDLGPTHIEGIWQTALHGNRTQNLAFDFGMFMDYPGVTIVLMLRRHLTFGIYPIVSLGTVIRDPLLIHRPEIENEPPQEYVYPDPTAPVEGAPYYALAQNRPPAPPNRLRLRTNSAEDLAIRNVIAAAQALGAATLRRNTQNLDPPRPRQALPERTPAPVQARGNGGPPGSHFRSHQSSSRDHSGRLSGTGAAYPPRQPAHTGNPSEASTIILPGPRRDGPGAAVLQPQQQRPQQQTLPPVANRGHAYYGTVSAHLPSAFGGPQRPSHAEAVRPSPSPSARRPAPSPSPSVSIKQESDDDDDDDESGGRVFLAPSRGPSRAPAALPRTPRPQQQQPQSHFRQGSRGSGLPVHPLTRTVRTSSGPVRTPSASIPSSTSPPLAIAALTSASRPPTPRRTIITSSALGISVTLPPSHAPSDRLPVELQTRLEAVASPNVVRHIEEILRGQESSRVSYASGRVVEILSGVDVMLMLDVVRWIEGRWDGGRRGV